MPSASQLPIQALQQLREGADRGRARLGSSLAGLDGFCPPTPAARSDTSTLLAALDALVQSWVALSQHPNRDFSPTAHEPSAHEPSAHEHEPEDFIFDVGCLWGELLIEQLRWRWINVQFTAQLEAIGVAPSDFSLVIYPFQTLYFYQQRRLPVRILRSFEVLSEPGRVPMLPPHQLENVMDHIE